nr:hypothetical protein [uncultured Carboxylicivirga sp.]
MNAKPTKLNNYLSIISLLLILFSVVLVFIPALKYPVIILFIPVTILSTYLAILNTNAELYRRAIFSASIALSGIIIPIIFFSNIISNPITLIFYYLLLVSAILYSIIFKSEAEKGYTFFEEVTNLPPVIMVLTAPIILAFGMHLYMNIVKSDIVLSSRENLQISSDEASITNPAALQAFKQARQALQMNNLETSTILLKKAMENQPNNAYVLYALYINFTIENNYEEAYNYITDAISSDPSSTRYLCEKAYLLFANEEYNQIKHLYASAKKINPHCPNTYFLKANIAYYIDNELPSVTYAYLDSAYWYCNNTYLKYRIQSFKNENCGINYYLNKVEPYQRNTLTRKLFFYSKVEEEPVIVIQKDNNNLMNTKRDETIMGVKNFIKFNNGYFKDEEVLFYYYFIDDQRYLKVLLETNSKLSIPDLYQLFKSDLFSKKVEVEILKEPTFRYL